MSMFLTIILVFCGGGIGASLRYLLGLIPTFHSFPLITLLINIFGSFIIGIIAGISEEKGLSNNLISFIKVGVLGGFTTFSSFSLDTITLFKKSDKLGTILYLGLSITLSLIACYLGELLVKLVIKKMA